MTVETDVKDTCDSCGAQGDGVAWWGAAYRRRELKKGRPDPGTLCGKCSGSREGTRIGEAVAR